MNTILTVFRKELQTTLRDRKTLISAIVIPALIVPVLMLGVGKLSSSLSDKEASKQLKIASFNVPPAAQSYLDDSTFTFIQNTPEAAARDSVSTEAYDAVLVFGKDYDSSVMNMQPAAVEIVAKSTNLQVEKRLREKLEVLQQSLLQARYAKLDISPETMQPLSISTTDMASAKEQIGVMVGGFLPYLFIIFCFTGCMYPAIDLFTGEKEKGTIETLLTVPASRLHILLGKVLTIAVVGVCAALMTMVGLFSIISISNQIPPEIIAVLQDILSVRFVLMLFAMLIPLSIFFAGILSAVAIRASSFKEAQSYITPLMFVVIVPAAIALMPGLKLSWQTAAIPVLNVALATKEIVAGTIQAGHYALIMVSLILLALAAVWVSKRQFGKEGNILK